MRSDQLEDLLDVEDEHSSHTMPIEASKLAELLGDERTTPPPPGPRFAPLVPRPGDDEHLDDDATIIDGKAPDADEIALTEAEIDDAVDAVSTAAIDAGQLAKLLDS